MTRARRILAARTHAARAFAVRAFVALLGAGVAAPAALAAQTVTGVLVERETGAPIAAALVTLLDGDGREVAVHVTDGDGRYRLRAPSPGRYTLRAERIGYERRESPPLALASDAAVAYRFEMATLAVRLEDIRVPVRSRCQAHPGRGAALARVWEQARQAVTAAAATAADARYRFRVVQWERRLDAATLRVEHEVSRWERLAGRSPFVSVAAASLEGDGFIQERDGDVLFYAPDLELLLSDAFLGMHCFRLVDGGDDGAGLIGLAFEPTRGRRVPGIRGTLWVDRESAELRHLDFRYDRIPWDVPTGNLGGRIEFARLATGRWIISRWWIRTPYLGARSFRTADGVAHHRTVIDAIHEEGAAVVEARGPDGRLFEWPDPDAEPERAAPAAPAAPAPSGELRVVRTVALFRGVPAQLSGWVLDAATGEPVAGAVVSVDGMQFQAVSDDDGRFRLRRVPTGSRVLRVVHDELGAAEDTLNVRQWEEIVVEVVLRGVVPGGGIEIDR